MDRIIAKFIEREENRSYIPDSLNNKNIYYVINRYLSEDKNIKTEIIERYGEINTWDVSNITNMSYLFCL